MNVTIKPLVWSESAQSHHTWSDTPFGRLRVWMCTRKTFVAEHRCGGVISEIADELPSADAAKLAAERWYVAKVLDCLEPADKETAAEFVTMYAQCNGEYDR